MQRISTKSTRTRTRKEQAEIPTMDFEIDWLVTGTE